MTWMNVFLFMYMKNEAIQKCEQGRLLCWKKTGKLVCLVAFCVFFGFYFVVLHFFLLFFFLLFYWAFYIIIKHFLLTFIENPLWEKKRKKENLL